MVDTEHQSSFNTILSRISARSNQYLNSRPKSSCSPSTLVGRVHIDLPEPPDLLPTLISVGARPEVAQAMQIAYYRRACEFRQQALIMISRACSKLTQIPSTCSHHPDETIIAAFQKIYLKKLDAWVSEGVALLQEKGPSVLCCREDDESVPAKFSKTFNHRCIPFLEHFFEENPFPAHADKVFLAKKFSMTYRQIHVWFQNRRNRTKKPLNKKPPTEAVTIPPVALIRKLEKAPILPAPKLDVPPCDRSTPAPSSTGVYSVLGSVAPPHAFPTTYPPRCEYDPFPSAPTFITPEWPRRPIVPSEKPNGFFVDVDELTEKFSRLNVWDDSQLRSRMKAGKASCGFAATSAITVMPSPAPHPACIRTVASTPTPRMIFQSIRAPESLHAFKSPSPCLPMTTLIPTLAHRRKLAALPKQALSRTPLTFDQEKSKSPSRSPALSSSSRSSSLGSEASMQSTRFTFNWSSNPSSTVTTPEIPSSPLPHST